jgi:hypothetical protein
MLTLEIERNQSFTFQKGFLILIFWGEGGRGVGIFSLHQHKCSIFLPNMTEEEGHGSTEGLGRTSSSSFRYSRVVKYLNRILHL